MNTEEERITSMHLNDCRQVTVDNQSKKHDIVIGIKKSRCQSKSKSVENIEEQRNGVKNKEANCKLHKNIKQNSALFAHMGFGQV